MDKSPPTMEGGENFPAMAGNSSGVPSARRSQHSFGNTGCEERCYTVPRVVVGRGRRVPHRVSSPSMLSCDASIEDEYLEEARHGRFYRSMGENGATSFISEEFVLRFLEQKGMLEAKQQLERILEKEKIAEGSDCQKEDRAENAFPTKSIDGHETMKTLETQCTSSISTTALGGSRSISCSDCAAVSAELQLDVSGTGSSKFPMRSESFPGVTLGSDIDCHDRADGVVPFFSPAPIKINSIHTSSASQRRCTSIRNNLQHDANESVGNLLPDVCALTCANGSHHDSVNNAMIETSQIRSTGATNNMEKNEASPTRTVEPTCNGTSASLNGQRKTHSSGDGDVEESSQDSDTDKHSSVSSTVSDITDLPSEMDLRVTPSQNGISHSSHDGNGNVQDSNFEGDNLPSKKHLEDSALAMAQAMSLLDQKRAVSVNDSSVDSSSARARTVDVVTGAYSTEEDENEIGNKLAASCASSCPRQRSSSAEKEHSTEASPTDYDETPSPTGDDNLPLKVQAEDSALATATALSFLDQKQPVSHAVSPGAVAVPNQPQVSPGAMPFFSNPENEDKLSIAAQGAASVNPSSAVISSERAKIVSEETRISEDNALIMGIVSSELTAKLADTSPSEMEDEHVVVESHDSSSCSHDESTNDDSSTSSASYQFSLTGEAVSNVGDDIETGSAVIQSVTPTATMIECAPVQAQVLNTVDAVLVEKTEPKEVRCSVSKRKRVCQVVSLLILAVIVVAFVVILVMQRKSRIAKEYSVKQRKEFILDIVSKLTNETQLLTKSTAQNNVFQWMSKSDISPADPPYRVEQRFALGMLYYSLGGENWTNKFSFMSDQNECLWNDGAVGCNEDGQVVKVSLANNNLIGRLPTEIVGLRNLQELWLGENDLKGSIPSVLGNITQLRVLSLYDNTMTGTIPETLYDLNLEILILDENSLYGTISPDIFKATSLTQLGLYGNNFKGTISSEFGRLQNLTSLALFRNELRGTIPKEIGSLKGLENLQISDNLLTGQIPEELGQLPKLWRMSLSYNDLTGTVPRSFTNLSSLDRLYLQTTLLVDDLTFLCERFPDLDVFRADLNEVNCPCCECCV